MVLAIVMVVKGYGYDGGCNGYGDDFDVDLNDGGGGDDDVFDSDTGWGNGDDIGGSGCGEDEDGYLARINIDTTILAEVNCM